MTITYLLNGSGGTDSDCTPGAQFNERAVVSREDTTAISITTARASSNILEASWTTPSGAPNDADWPTGDYVSSIEVTSVDADMTYRTALRRVNSSCTSQEVIGTGSLSSSTGTYTWTASSFNPAAGAAGDRFQTVLTQTNAAAHQNNTVTYDLSSANSFMSGPWTPPAATRRVFVVS